MNRMIGLVLRDGAVRRATEDFARRGVDRLVRDDGTVAIEFAVVGLLFFALLLGSIEMGRAMWMRNSVQFAAEEAARWALVQPAENTTAVADFARGRLTGSPETATITAPYVTVSGVRYVVVTITQDFTPVTTLVSTGKITMTGRARFPIK
jgi:Flp pilus assembly protein TadG